MCQIVANGFALRFVRGKKIGDFSTEAILLLNVCRFVLNPI
jgi:hypothetical protein